jgi:hypothetical protein
MRRAGQKRPRHREWPPALNEGIETRPSRSPASGETNDSHSAVSGKGARPPLRQLDSLWVFTTLEAISHCRTVPGESITGPDVPSTLTIEADEQRRRLAMAFMDRLCRRVGEPVSNAASADAAASAVESNGTDRAGLGERVRSGLRLPVTTLIVARLLFHRFFLLEPFGEPFNDLDIATACVSIACKATENVVRMGELVRHSYGIRTAGRLVLDEQLHRDLFVRCRERIAQAERDVLRNLNWDLDVGESVHRTMFAQWAQFEKLARAQAGDALPWPETAAKPLLQVACSFLNEAHRTVCACLYPREELAAAALCLAMCLCRLPAGDYVAPWLRTCNVDAATLASALDRMRADYFARLCRAQVRVADRAVWQRLGDSVRDLVPQPNTHFGGCAVEISIDHGVAAAHPFTRTTLPSPAITFRRNEAKASVGSASFTKPAKEHSIESRRAELNASDSNRRRRTRRPRPLPRRDWPRDRVNTQGRPESLQVLEPPFQ